MNEELLLHLDLVLVLILIGSQLGDLLLSVDALNTALQRILLVNARLIEGLNSVLTLDLLRVNLQHDLAQSLISLIALLLGHAQLLGLRFMSSLL